MSFSEGQRDLVISQSHSGTRLLAPLIGIPVTCLFAAVALALVWQLTRSAGWLLFLFLLAVGAVLLVGSYVLSWSERFLPLLWPSGRRLSLREDHLTLSHGDKVESQIRWEEPFEALRWRVYGNDSLFGSTSLSDQFVLACQLKQGLHIITLFTSCSALDWRRTPSWKQFPLLDPDQGRSMGLFQGIVAQSPLKRRAAPSHRGVSSLSQADPESVWPAEYDRHRNGWGLSFEDFRSVMMFVERSLQTQEHHD